MFACGILSVDVTLIDTSMRDLKTSFGGTRIANNRVLCLSRYHTSAGTEYIHDRPEYGSETGSDV